MKKIVLLAPFFVIAIMLFVLPISAEAGFGPLAEKIDDSIVPQRHIFGDELHGSAEHCDGWYNENCARVLLKYTVNGQEVVATYPAYYILENDSTLTWNFERLGNYLGVNLSVANIISIEIPYGVTEVPRRAFVDDNHWIEDGTSEKPYPHATESSTLTYVKVPNSLLKIGDFAFAHCVALAELESETLADHEGEGNGAVQGNHNHQMIESIGYRAFHDCPLTTFNFNKHLRHLGEGAFEGCHFTKINLSKCVELKTIPAYCFHENDNYHISEIILSSSIEEIGDYAFTGSSASYIFLGTHLKKIGRSAVTMAGKVELLVIPATITEIYNDSIVTQSKDYTPVIVSAKDASDVEALMNLFNDSGSDFKFAGNASKVLAKSLDYLSSTTLCADFLGGHMIDPSSNVTDIIYPYGIDHEGVAYGGACLVCQQATEETTVRPILISKGYSVCLYDDMPAFVNGFEIYSNALEAYEAVYGECEIGIVFLTKTIYDMFVTEGIDVRNNIEYLGDYLTEAQLSATMDRNISSLEFIVTYSKGLGYVDGSEIARGDEQLIISAYLLHKDESKAYKDVVMPAADGTLEMGREVYYNTSFYVQDTDDLCVGGKTKDEKYLTVSYNSIYGYIDAQNSH